MMKAFQAQISTDPASRPGIAPNSAVLSAGMTILCKKKTAAP
jgi:hypothetical protein